MAEVEDVLTDALGEIEQAVGDVVPLADVEERDDSYVLDVELLGVRRGDVSVEVVQGRLTITGERRERHRVGLLRYRTRTTGRFRLELTLPVDVDTDEITASLDPGRRACCSTCPRIDLPARGRPARGHDATPSCSRVLAVI